MNRAERRKAAKEQRNNNIGRNTNSKHNFVDMGKWDIPINELKQDENLKDPNADPEVMELFNEVYTKWMGSTLVKNLYSKVLITLGMEYLDTLTSLKFDLIPMEDRVYVRDTVYHIQSMKSMLRIMQNPDQSLLSHIISRSWRLICCSLRNITK